MGFRGLEGCDQLGRWVTGLHAPLVGSRCPGWSGSASPSAITWTRRSWHGWCRRWVWGCLGEHQAPCIQGGSASPHVRQGSEVNVIGIGTSVVTCPQQPSLGCVYKVGLASQAQVGGGRGHSQLAQQPMLPQLVCVGGQPRMKLTEDLEKQTLPGKKAAFRLLDADGGWAHYPDVPSSL